MPSSVSPSGGDGWCPNRVDYDYLKEQLGVLKGECAAVGRDYGKLDITLMGTIKGARDTVQAELERFEAIGVNRFVVMTSILTPDNYREKLGQYAATYL